ncbi:MAG: hypothetical protein ABI995_10525 [Acidobacteriota bacterium]
MKELEELRQLESDLASKWIRLKNAGEAARMSFVVSLGELEGRAERLEQLVNVT